MIRNLIIEFAPMLVILLIIIFTIIKVSIISISMNKNYFSLFLNSFWFYNRVTVRNTFHEKLKEFYKRSNRINKIFYIIFAIVIVVYLLMKAI